MTLNDSSISSHILTNLTNGLNYTISIVATSDIFNSSNVTVGPISLGELMDNHFLRVEILFSYPVPGQPTLNAGSTTATSISISWSVPSGFVVTSFLVQWQRNTAIGCPDEDQDSTTIMDGSLTTYDITGLEEDSEYSVTVTASNTVGSSAVSNIITGMTLEAGEGLTLLILYISHWSISPAPTAPPSNVNVTSVTSTSITVQWGMVPCIHQNGDITGYSVRYGVMGTSEGDKEVKMVSGDSRGGMTTITGLEAGTVYEYEVEAQTVPGTGVYSSVMTTLTPGKQVD